MGVEAIKTLTDYLSDILRYVSLERVLLVVGSLADGMMSISRYMQKVQKQIFTTEYENPAPDYVSLTNAIWHKACITLSYFPFLYLWRQHPLVKWRVQRTTTYNSHYSLYDQYQFYYTMQCKDDDDGTICAVFYSLSKVVQASRSSVLLVALSCNREWLVHHSSIKEDSLGIFHMLPDFSVKCIQTLLVLLFAAIGT